VGDGRKGSQTSRQGSGVAREKKGPVATKKQKAFAGKNEKVKKETSLVYIGGGIQPEKIAPTFEARKWGRGGKVCEGGKGGEVSRGSVK